MKRALFWVVASWAGLASLGATAHGAQTDSLRFRDLVFKSFEDDDFAGPGQRIGLGDAKLDFSALEYKVLLVEGPDGEGRHVDPKGHRFQVGQQIKIVVRPLAKSHLYVYHVGASGKGAFLLPRDDEEATPAEAGRDVKLPEEGFFQFVEPPGDETLYVIAAAKPVRDRALLAKVVAAKDPAQDTSAMKEQRREINAVVEGALKSELERKIEKSEGSIKYRGMFSPADREEFLRDLKARAVRRGTIEIPAQRAGEGTLAVGFRARDLPTSAGQALVVAIPLRSGEPNR